MTIIIVKVRSNVLVHVFLPSLVVSSKSTNYWLVISRINEQDGVKYFFNVISDIGNDFFNFIMFSQASFYVIQKPGWAWSYRTTFTEYQIYTVLPEKSQNTQNCSQFFKFRTFDFARENCLDLITSCKGADFSIDHVPKMLYKKSKLEIEQTYHLHHQTSSKQNWMQTFPSSHLKQIKTILQIL